MTVWLPHSPIRPYPRLWVEKLWLLESRTPLEVVRQVDFHPGLNIVWAREPAGGKGGARAGHGVGKTSLCLLLRYCLGDEASSISSLREKSLAGFPQGGVAAKVHLDDVAWLVWRPYAERVPSITGRGDDLVALLAGELAGDWAEYAAALDRAFIAPLPGTTLPGSQQELEWRHLLAWCVRDQKTRFDHFYHWRDGDGLGFRRPRLDPPRFVQMVLGLMDAETDRLLREIEECEVQLHGQERQRAEAAQLLNSTEQTQRRQLERLLKTESGLPIFEITAGPSLQSRLAESLAFAGKEEDNLVQEIAAAETALDALALGRAEARREADIRKAEWGRAQALLDNNQREYERLSNELQRLENLAGRCQHGDVEFAECEYIQNRRDHPSLPWRMDLHEAELNKPIREIALRKAVARHEAAAAQSREAESRYGDAKAGLQRLRNRLASSEVRRDMLQAAWKELGETIIQRTQEAPSSPERATLARRRDEIERLLLGKTQSQATRAGALKALTRALALRLLGEAGYGRFVPESDDRPFELALGGEAYQVLEVLIGDLVCLLDAAVTRENHHPCFLVHDCPREADMSEHLYREYLLAAAEAADALARDDAVPFQYIVTTTSAPPASVQDRKHIALELSPGSGDGLLFKRRLQPQLFDEPA